jgi:hypothetical protein
MVCFASFPFLCWNTISFLPLTTYDAHAVSAITTDAFGNLLTGTLLYHFEQFGRSQALPLSRNVTPLPGHRLSGRTRQSRSHHFSPAERSARRIFRARHRGLIQLRKTNLGGPGHRSHWVWDCLKWYSTLLSLS